jgi:hypothetical protein
VVQTIPRRIFLVLGGSALITPSICLSAEVPALLDHILLGCSEVDRGVAFVRQHTGVRAMLGGVHPGGGTQNALLSLGKQRYLEILAPDPAQTDAQSPLVSRLRRLLDPKLLGWAAHPGDLTAFAAKLREARIAFEGPTRGSRRRPDGLFLQWQRLVLQDDASGMLPFFIEWSTDSVHPSADSPKGCSLIRFEAATPDPRALAKQVSLLGLDLRVITADRPELRATLAGPNGQLTLVS